VSRDPFGTVGHRELLERPRRPPVLGRQRPSGLVEKLDGSVGNPHRVGHRADHTVKDPVGHYRVLELSSDPVHR
jgi:hypothetical protein